MRELNHNYINYLVSLDGLLEDRKVDEANSYVKSILTKIDRTHHQSGGSHADGLKNINSGELKALLFSKIQLMDEYQIDYRLQINDPVIISKKNLLDIITIVGNLIDNAIDAAKDQPDARIEIKFKMASEEVGEFTIFNTTTEQLDLEKSFQNGFTTKEKHSGIRLNIVREIIDSSPDHALEIESTDNSVEFGFIIRGHRDDD